MKRLYGISAAMAVTALIASGSCLAKESRLDDVVREVQAQSGGTLVSVQPRGSYFQAVLLDPNGVTKTAMYDAGWKEIRTIGPSTHREAPLDAQAVRGAKIRLSEAVRTAEDLSGGQAQSARLVADDSNLAFQVTVAGPSVQKIYIDARNGQQLTPTG